MKKIIKLLLILLILPITVQAEEGYLYDVLEQQYNDGLAVKKYEGDHKDSMSGNGDKGIYYFYAKTNFDAIQVLDSNNVIFGDQCWQILRTTDNGGVRLLYNGQVENNQCLMDRGNPFGFGWSKSLYPENGTYYSPSFKYDKTNKTFKLDGDIISVDLNENNGNSLIGYFTCNSTSSDEECTQLYYIEKFYISSSDQTPYFYGRYIEKSNANNGIAPATFAYGNSIGEVGYMYTPGLETYSDKQYSSNAQVYGSDYIYENNRYKLTGTRVGINSSHHYSCGSSDPEATCEELRYYHYHYYEFYDYIILKDGKTVEETLNEVLTSDSVNQKDSKAKTFIDLWYKTILIDYEDNLDMDTIYCGDRTISDYGPFNPKAGGTDSNSQYSILYFKGGKDETSSLYCSNATDRYSVNNSKAQLTYPVALPTYEELRILESSKLVYSYEHYQTMTPATIRSGDCIDNMVYAIYSNEPGLFHDSRISNSYLLRPVVTLKPGTKYMSGDGSAINPYVIKPVVYNSIEVEENEKGNVDIEIENPDKIEEDSIVTFTAKPKLGYVLGEMKILDEEGNEIEFTQEGNEFSFVMPASKVIITPTYEPIVVINPETGQLYFLIIIAISFISGILVIILRKKQLEY